MKSSYAARNGGPRQRIFHKNSGPKAKARRAVAHQNLLNQLIKGTKNTSDGEVLLNEEDVERIHKEIGILSKKLM